MTRSINHTLLACLLLFCVGCSAASRDPSGKSSSDENAIDRTTEKGPVKLTVKITPRTPRLSDLVQMEVEVSAPADVEIKPPEFGAAVGDFVVRDYSERKAESQQAQSGAQSRRFHYQLEPSEAGRHLIRSIAIEFVDNRPESESRGEPALIETDPIEVHVTSELGDQVPNLDNLEPMLPPRPLVQSTRWGWLLGLAAVIVAALLFWRRLRKKADIVVVRKQTPEEIAHAALAALLSEDLPSQGLFKEFYLRLTGIVRHYIEGTTGLRAPEQTTEEFLREIRSGDVFPAERMLRLKEFLEAADMVKYAGQQPEGEQIEQSISRAREFVEMRSQAAIAAAAEAS